MKIWQVSKIERDTMERKKFNRGTIGGGIARIVISAIAIIIAIIVLSSAIKSWRSENIGSGIFMCIISAIMVVASLSFITNGVKMILDGKKSLEVLRKGRAEFGRIIDLSVTEVTENNNGCVAHYNIFNLKFEYTDESGRLCESQEQVSQKVYTQLQEMTLVPILVYGERAVFDKKRLNNENDEKSSQAN